MRQTYPDLGFDPAPGRSADVEALLARLTETEAALVEVASGLSRSARPGAWRGTAAAAFRAGVGTLADAAREVAAAVVATREPLTTWSARLSANQREADRLDRLAGTVRDEPEALARVVAEAWRLRGRHLREAAAAVEALRGSGGEGWWGPSGATAAVAGQVSVWSGGLAVLVAPPPPTGLAALPLDAVPTPLPSGFLPAVPPNGVVTPAVAFPAAPVPTAPAAVQLDSVPARWSTPVEPSTRVVDLWSGPGTTARRSATPDSRVERDEPSRRLPIGRTPPVPAAHRSPSDHSRPADRRGADRRPATGPLPGHEEPGRTSRPAGARVEPPAARIAAPPDLTPHPSSAEPPPRQPPAGPPPGPAVPGPQPRPAGPIASDPLARAPSPPTSDPARTAGPATSAPPARTAGPSTSDPQARTAGPATSDPTRTPGPNTSNPPARTAGAHTSDPTRPPSPTSPNPLTRPVPQAWPASAPAGTGTASTHAPAHGTDHDDQDTDLGLVAMPVAPGVRTHRPAPPTRPRARLIAFVLSPTDSDTDSATDSDTDTDTLVLALVLVRADDHGRVRHDHLFLAPLCADFASPRTPAGPPPPHQRLLTTNERNANG
ncbi:hypothetical protein [Actinophytocola xanthii]|uniref:Uncharacterized protein n=1 Tax=Actinophytocola xanthii TaxID=1912961 RepID=A0A1Q8CW85_9PSEU|nr:hypothetical protein [Actinophytocola xanthii]OLF18619.1 hypothetical protein BU204_04970 [Actinophytocola xanthii]